MLSIIIPTLNEERFIERTLKNLRTIHSVPYEIIVADTGSTDKTREIASRYADVVVVYEGDEKPNAAIIRNLGAKVAKGEILLFQDADVILGGADSFVKRACFVLRETPSLVALTTAARVDPESENLTDRFMYWMINNTFVLLNNVLRVGGASGECQIVRCKSFEQIGGYNATLPVGEDNELFQRLARIGRTRILTDLVTFQTGRRQHAIGWTRLLLQWWSNWVAITFFHKSASNHWDEIR